MNGEKMNEISNIIISATTTYYLFSDKIRNYCENKKSLCVFSIVVECAEKIFENIDKPSIDITLREVNNLPTYLKKTAIKWIILVMIIIIIYIQI